MFIAPNIAAGCQIKYDEMFDYADECRRAAEVDLKLAMQGDDQWSEYMLDQHSGIFSNLLPKITEILFSNEPACEIRDDLRDMFKVMVAQYSEETKP